MVGQGEGLEQARAEPIQPKYVTFKDFMPGRPPPPSQLNTELKSSSLFCFFSQESLEAESALWFCGLLQTQEGITERKCTE